MLSTPGNVSYCLVGRLILPPEGSSRAYTSSMYFLLFKQPLYLLLLSITLGKNLPKHKNQISLDVSLSLPIPDIKGVLLFRSRYSGQ
jgi:hypothetical protein